MTSHADTRAEQERLQRQLAALPDPLPGSPDHLRAYADFLLGEAAKAAEFKHREAAMPGRVVFISDGAMRLYANMGEVAQSYGTAHDLLHHAAMSIRSHASQVQGSQAHWNHESKRLVDELSRLQKT